MEKVTVASIHVRKCRYLLKSKKIIFKVLIKLSDICAKKEIHRPEKCSCRSWSRSRNSDFQLRGAGAKRNIYSSATLLLGYKIQIENTKELT
jgi:hypothetical protein